MVEGHEGLPHVHWPLGTRKRRYCFSSCQDDGTDHADLPEWTKRDQQAMGSILLHVTPSIQQDLQSEIDSEDIWNHLQTAYGTATPTSMLRFASFPTFLPADHDTLDDYGIALTHGVLPRIPF